MRTIIIIITATRKVARSNLKSISRSASCSFFCFSINSIIGYGMSRHGGRSGIGRCIVLFGYRVSTPAHEGFSVAALCRGGEDNICSLNIFHFGAFVSVHAPCDGIGRNGCYGSRNSHIACRHGESLCSTGAGCRDCGVRGVVRHSDRAELITAVWRYGDSDCRSELCGRGRACG